MHMAGVWKATELRYATRLIWGKNVYGPVVHVHCGSTSLCVWSVCPDAVECNVGSCVCIWTVVMTSACDLWVFCTLLVGAVLGSGRCLCFGRAPCLFLSCTVFDDPALVWDVCQKVGSLSLLPEIAACPYSLLSLLIAMSLVCNFNIPVFRHLSSSLCV